MSLKAEFRKFIKTKPVPPYATLPKSGIDVEWNDLLNAWKIDMGMDVNEFLTRNPDIKANIQARNPGMNLENVSPRDILKRGLAEQILSELIDATDVPDEADRVFKGQRLRSIGSGTLTAEARDKLYERALDRGQLPERTIKNPTGGVRQTGRKPKTFGNGLIPEDTAFEAFENYSRLRTLEIEEALAMNKKPKTRGGQFMVKDKQGKKHYFGFEQAGYKKGAPAKRTFMLDGMGYKIYPATEKAFRDATRETLKLNQTPSNMTPRQWLQIKDLYDQAGASKGKLEVDHIWPLEKGGLHEPGNLRLLDTTANRSKGAKVGTDFPDAPYNARIGFSKTEWGWADRMAKKHGSLFRKLGGVSTRLSGADSAIQFASGNYLGGGIGLAMQTPTFQKAIAKRLAKSGAKMIPGVGVSMSALEAAGYASQGRWTQAGIASLSGLVGEVPLAGDLVSAALDLTNTGIDLATGNLGGSPDEDKIKRQVGGSFDFSKPRTYVPSKFRF